MKKIIFFSGAGISAPSGIKTFRGKNGLWNGESLDKICNDNTWRANFKEVHEFYNKLRSELADVVPNIAHKTIAKLQKKYGVENVFNVTQNIDDLFERASAKVLHLHGELIKMTCQNCNNVWEIGYKKVEIKTDKCPKCNSGKDLKPFIVFYYGSAPMYMKMAEIFDLANSKNTTVVVIGTMGNVVPIDSMLRGKPCKKILCNLEPSEYLPEGIYDKVYYQSIETAIIEIEEMICT